MYRTGFSKGGPTRTVTEGYDSVKKQTLAERNASDLVNLRKFQNEVKRVLISEYISQDANVLDFCGGKAGDFPKLYFLFSFLLLFLSLIFRSFI